jgi:predicted aldo/keto reductase-like oxidoreductase
MLWDTLTAIGRLSSNLPLGGKMMDTVERINDIPTRILGRTGIRVTVLGMGGYHMAKGRDPQVGFRVIRTAIDEGINFLDNAWCYNDGESERIMGRALRDGYREKVFLMTKNHGRDGATFRRQLDESLKRLQSDYIDLLQFHEIIHEGEPDRIFSEGAIEEAIKARGEGKIRFIGFTGHRWPHLFKQMLGQDFEWDTVQMPTNLLDYHHRSFTKEILPTLVKRDIGIIGMKSLGGSGAPILKTGITLQEAISYALSLPIHTLVSGMDSLEVLAQNLEIVRNWRPLSDEERNKLLERIASWAADGHLERYKTA